MVWVGPHGPQSDLHRWKRAASRIGIPVDQYIRHIEDGEKWCSGHGQWEDKQDFGNSRRDGLQTACKAWMSAYQRRRRAS